MCSKQKLCKNDCDECFNRSFASHPKAQYWSSKNELTPRDVFASSHKKYTFDCGECGHEFTMKLNAISNTNNNSWCCYCGHQKLCSQHNCNFCFNSSFASHPKAQYWSSKNELTPRDVFAKSSNKYTFDCCYCGHEFTSILSNISNGSWCPYCCVGRKKLCNGPDCNICFNHSFASSPKSKYWSSRNSVNPRDVTLSNDASYYFNCDVCGHEFLSRLGHITCCKSWCCYCGNQKLCSQPDCNICFEKSFSSSPKAQYWSSENKYSPRDVFKSSNIPCLFECGECNHKFSIRLTIITNNKSWCPFCSSKQMCPREDCQECFNKSFLSHPRSKFWSSKNKKTPRECFKNSHSKYHFVCDKGSRS